MFITNGRKYKSDQSVSPIILICSQVSYLLTYRFSSKISGQLEKLRRYEKGLEIYSVEHFLLMTPTKRVTYPVRYRGNAASDDACFFLICQFVPSQNVSRS